MTFPGIGDNELEAVCSLYLGTESKRVCWLKVITSNSNMTYKAGGKNTAELLLHVNNTPFLDDEIDVPQSHVLDLRLSGE